MLSKGEGDMKKIYGVLFGISILLAFSGSVTAQPTDLGEFCFESDIGSSGKYVWTFQATDMGNDHIAINGFVDRVPDPYSSIIITGSETIHPLHGVAELNDGKVYMTLQKSFHYSTPLSGGTEYMHADTVFIEIDFDTYSGTYRLIRQTHNITADKDSTSYDSGTFEECTQQ